ncbi:MAG: hypothetical protein JWO30_4589 [Fibrobacteres bacterium]|nr:hypothetical protein [Fibrobacterota bacterium]
MVSVFDYLDYRKYLAEYYRWKKSVNRHFSYRLIAEKAGIASTGYFSEVLSGRRNLTRAKIPKFSKAFNLSEAEEHYLSLLVAFTDAKTEAAKQIVYELLVAAMPVKTQRLKQSQREYFSKWYYVAVREALAVHEVRDNPEELASLLRPAITVSQTKAALRLLESLQLISRDAEGRWRATQVSLLSQKDESTALLVRGFQGEMIDLARRALTEVTPQDRDISCVTMSVSAQGLERVKAVIKDCRKRILEIVQSDQNEDRVVQMNLQVFPITHPKASHVQA